MTVSPGPSLLQSDLMDVYKYLKGGCEEGGARHLSAVPSDRIGAMGANQNRKFHLNTRKCFPPPPHFHWCSLSTEVVESPHFGDTQNPSGHGPGQPILGGPA